MTHSEFAKKFQLKLSNQQVLARTDGLMEMGEGARHFICTIKQVGFGNKQSVILNYSQGSAHTKPPTITDVLESVALDCSGVENTRTFEEWADESGYDTDSRKAERIYIACLDQRAKFQTLLGHEAYKTFLECEEA